MSIVGQMKVAAVAAVGLGAIFGQSLAVVTLSAGVVLAETPIIGVAAVVMGRADDVVVAEGVSGETGEVMFKDLKPGEYRLRIGESKPTEFAIAEGETGILVRVTGKRRNYVGHVTLLR